MALCVVHPFDATSCRDALILQQVSLLVVQIVQYIWYSEEDVLDIEIVRHDCTTLFAKKAVRFGHSFGYSI